MSSDMRDVERLHKELDMPKPRPYLVMLWEPILSKAKRRFGDLIVDVKEVPSLDGTGDITFEILVKDRKMDVLDFFAGETLELLLRYAVSIHTLVHRVEGNAL